MKKTANFRFVLPFYNCYDNDRTVGHVIEVQYELDIDDKTKEIKNKEIKQVLMGYAEFEYKGSLFHITKEKYDLPIKVDKKFFCSFDEVGDHLFRCWSTDKIFKEFISGEKEEHTFLVMEEEDYLEKSF